jgi:hypothetical protein
MRINSPDWYPCYLNPDFGEVLELAKSGWDTIRILAEQPHGKVVESTPGDLIIASGLGNTHSSIMDAYAKSKGGYRVVNGRVRYRGIPHVTPYILYHENRIALFNLEDCSGSQRARFSEAEKYFYSGHAELLRDLIRESDLSL